MPTISANGLNFHYIEAGSGPETIVFSHAMLFPVLNKDDQPLGWRDQFKHFAEAGYRCIAYDHRGQGKSERREPFDMETCADDATALIEALSPGRPVHVVGHSQGGYVALRVAARTPQLVRSLTLVGTSADEEPNGWQYSIMTLVVKVIGPRLLMPLMVKMMVSPTTLETPQGKALVDEMKAQVSSFAWSGKASTWPLLQAINKRKALKDEELASITCPTLIMVGDRDTVDDPTKAESMHNRIQGSTLHVIPRAGHFVPLERPDVVNSHMADHFLAAAGGEGPAGGGGGAGIEE